MRASTAIVSKMYDGSPQVKQQPALMWKVVPTCLQSSVTAVRQTERQRLGDSNSTVPQQTCDMSQSVLASIDMSVDKILYDAGSNLSEVSLDFGNVYPMRASHLVNENPAAWV